MPRKKHELDMSWIHFPTLTSLPPGGDAPLRGWMFLCEAVQDLSPEFPAPAFKCRDVCGAELLVVFFPDRGVSPQITPGKTLCIENAVMHRFAGGRVGVRVERSAMCVVLPLSLEELTALNERVTKNGSACARCGAADAQSRCAQCASHYCSRDCQRSDWAPRHRRECVPTKHLRAWNDKYE